MSVEFELHATTGFAVRIQPAHLIAHIIVYEKYRDTIMTLRMCNAFGKGSIRKLPVETIELIHDKLIEDDLLDELRKWYRLQRCHAEGEVFCPADHLIRHMANGEDAWDVLELFCEEYDHDSRYYGLCNNCLSVMKFRHIFDVKDDLWYDEFNTFASKYAESHFNWMEVCHKEQEVYLKWIAPAQGATKRDTIGEALLKKWFGLIPWWSMSRDEHNLRQVKVHLLSADIPVKRTGNAGDKTDGELDDGLDDVMVLEMKPLSTEDCDRFRTAVRRLRLKVLDHSTGEPISVWQPKLTHLVRAVYTEHL